MLITPKVILRNTSIIIWEEVSDITSARKGQTRCLSINLFKIITVL